MEFTNSAKPVDIRGIFEKHFPSNKYYVQVNDFGIFVYYKSSEINETELDEDTACLHVFMGDDKIIYLNKLKYDKPTICKATGAELLYSLYNVAKELGYNIVLEDSSYKFFPLREGSRAVCQIDLATYNILLTGESWYNKYGYYSEDHNDNKSSNKKIMNKMLSECLTENTINELTTIDSRLTGELSIHEMMKIIDEIIKQPREKPLTCVDDLIQLLNTRIIGKLKLNIVYNKYLQLDINDPTVAEIYEKLGKKLVGGRRRRKTCRKSCRKKRSNRRR